MTKSVLIALLACIAALAAASPQRAEGAASCRSVNVIQMWRLTHRPHFTSTIAYIRKGGVTYCMSLAEISIGDGHWIDDVSGFGSTVSLEDGSLWLISPIDRPTVSLWLPVDEITVRRTGDPGYPYLLINTDEGETAQARFLASN